MTNLSTKLFDLTLKNPVMPAAGPPVKDGQAALAAARGGAGAIVTKTISVKPARVPRPNMARINGGFLNTELWSELSPEQWLEKEYPLAVKTGLPLIVGLGYTAAEIRELAVKVAPFAAALELSTHYLGNDPAPVIASIKAAREVVDLPVMVKLSPQVDIPRFARAAEEAGADGLVLINSFGPVLDIDLKTGRPLMGSAGGEGWLSGEAIFPLALHAVYQAAQSVRIPVIGVGGISSWREGIKMIMAGARAVQICTAAILKGPSIYGQVADGMSNYLTDNGYSALDEIRGMALSSPNSGNTGIEKANYQTIVPELTEENCTGCGLCWESCVYEAITLKRKGGLITIDPQKCAGCGLCVTRCKFSALSLY